MIVVRVELHSAITGVKTELARMIISNDGTGSAECGDYDAATLRGRSAVQLDRLQVQRRGRVEAYPRLRLHVWYLVARALRAMRYE